MINTIGLTCESHKVINKCQDHVWTGDMSDNILLESRLIIDNVVLDASHSGCI